MGKINSKHLNFHNWNVDSFMHYTLSNFYFYFCFHSFFGQTFCWKLYDNCVLGYTLEAYSFLHIQGYTCTLYSVFSSVTLLNKNGNNGSNNKNDDDNASENQENKRTNRVEIFYGRWMKQYRSRPPSTRTATNAVRKSTWRQIVQ